MFDTLVFKESCPYARALTGSNLVTQAQIDKYIAGERVITVAEYQTTLSR